jgi:CRISPR-associated protein Csb2
MLALDVEWLTGVCVATRSPADDAPEWPPQPDRIFSALVASFGAHGGRAEERAALEWLEAQEPPRLDAVDAFPRVAVTAFVPPNDVASLPEGRRRQPRRFPASVPLAEPGATHLRLVWAAADAAAHLPALQALARDASYIGHSSALVRCRFSAEDAATEGLVPARAAPYSGRLAELERLYRRHVEKGDANARPRREFLAARFETAPAAPSSLFGHRWIVLEAEEGERPDIRSAAIVARLLRAALMEKFATSIPPWLSGHMPDGAPTTDPHIAIVPLADIGWRHSDGGLKGLALVVPRALADEWRAAATPAAFAEAGVLSGALARLHDEDGAIELAEPSGKPGRIVWRLREAPDPDLHSLKPHRYCMTSTVWSTATPIALDRFPKAQGAARLAEAAEIVARACVNIGLPAPASVEVHKHSAFRGAPSAWPPGGAPRWTCWARPKALADRPLFHATLRFDKPVCGPLILGAGRFFGLGLCLPLGARA